MQWILSQTQLNIIPKCISWSQHDIIPQSDYLQGTTSRLWRDRWNILLDLLHFSDRFLICNKWGHALSFRKAWTGPWRHFRLSGAFVVGRMNNVWTLERHPMLKTWWIARPVDNKWYFLKSHKNHFEETSFDKIHISIFLQYFIPYVLLEARLNLGLKDYPVFYVGKHIDFIFLWFSRSWICFLKFNLRMRVANPTIHRTKLKTFNPSSHRN